MSLVSEVDRAVARKRIEQLVRQVEHAKKPNPASDEEIRKTVEGWEEKIFNKNKAQPQKYQEKIEAKAQDCQKELREAAAGAASKAQAAPPAAVAAAPAPVPAPAPAPTRPSAAPAAAPQQKNARAPTAAAQRAQEPAEQQAQAPRTVVPPTATAAPVRPAPSTAASSAPARPPAQAQPSAPPPASRATQPSERISPTVPANVGSTAASTAPSTGAAASATATSSSKDYRKIEELREPLEQCRSMLRVLNVFGMGKKDHQLKEDFMRIFQQTTEVIKKHKQTKISSQEMEDEVVKIGRHLMALREKLDPRFAVIETQLHVGTVNEVFELDALPFGLLERLMQFEKHVKHADRCKRASWMLGGRQVLKRAREQSS